MITCSEKVFHLDTKQTSYVFRITKFGHPESIYYGDRIVPQDVTALLLKHTAMIGSTIPYDSSDDLYCLDTLSLEYSGIGKGDFRHSPVEIKMPDGSFVCDFTYVSHRMFDGFQKSDSLPTAYGEVSQCQTLEILLRDEPIRRFADPLLHRLPETDVITRRAVLKNGGQKPLVIRKLMSMMLDLNIGAHQ